jgi:acyl-CoA thioester hydrolase
MKTLEESVEPYIFKVVARFSDTDLYGVVHHSNYFRWMEEARFQFTEDVLELSVNDFNKMQLQFPVTHIEGKYIKSVFARQPITVSLVLYYNNTTKLIFRYEIKNDEGQSVFRGKTEHVLTKDNEMLLALPEYLEKFINSRIENLENQYIIKY